MFKEDRILKGLYSLNTIPEGSIPERKLLGTHNLLYCYLFTVGFEGQVENIGLPMYS